MLFRSNTADVEVWNSVVHFNEYEVKDLSPNSVVVDIGMHIGAFSYLTKMMGAGYVYGYELDKENFSLAVENLKGFDDCNLFNLAVVRSDKPNPRFIAVDRHGDWNTGDSNVFWGNGMYACATIRFDDIMEDVLKVHKKVDILKLDCEGSEFPILYTTKHLDKIDKIVMEFHEVGGDKDGCTVPKHMLIDGRPSFLATELVEYLETNGFRTRGWGVGVNTLGKIWATKKESEHANFNHNSNSG